MAVKSVLLMHMFCLHFLFQKNYRLEFNYLLFETKKCKQNMSRTDLTASLIVCICALYVKYMEIYKFKSVIYNLEVMFFGIVCCIFVKT